MLIRQVAMPIHLHLSLQVEHLRNSQEEQDSPVDIQERPLAPQVQLNPNVQ